MPGQARLDAPGTLDHSMARGIERRNIFLGHVYGEPCRGGELDPLAQWLLETLTDP